MLWEKETAVLEGAVQITPEEFKPNIERSKRSKSHETNHITINNNQQTLTVLSHYPAFEDLKVLYN